MAKWDEKNSDEKVEALRVELREMVGAFYNLLDEYAKLQAHFYAHSHGGNGVPTIQVGMTVRAVPRRKTDPLE